MSRQRGWLGLGLILLAGCRGSADEEILARVNDAVLTRSELERMLPGGLQGGMPGLEERDLVERWVESELLYQEARRQGLHQDPSLQTRVAEFERMLLENELLRRELEGWAQVSDEAVEEYYRTHQEEFIRTAEERRVSQIVIADSATAVRLAAQLKADPTQFAEIAAARSMDVSSLDDGDLGYFALEELNEPMRRAATQLRKGQVSGPIHLPPFGYALLKVTDIQPAGSVRPLSAVRQQVRDHLLYEAEQQGRQTLLERLRAQADVTVRLSEVSP